MPHRLAADGWTADPDDQFLLDVNIRQLRLGDGVRAYPTPEGTCIVFGDFLTALDVPMKIDLEARKRQRLGVQGRPQDRTSTAPRARSASAPRPKQLAKGMIRDVPEGWCVDSAALGRWFGIKVMPQHQWLGADP